MIVLLEFSCKGIIENEQFFDSQIARIGFYWQKQVSKHQSQDRGFEGFRFLNQNGPAVNCFVVQTCHVLRPAQLHGRAVRNAKQTHAGPQSPRISTKHRPISICSRSPANRRRLHRQSTAHRGRRPAILPAKALGRPNWNQNKGTKLGPTDSQGSETEPPDDPAHSHHSHCILPSPTGRPCVMVMPEL